MTSVLVVHGLAVALGIAWTRTHRTRWVPTMTSLVATVALVLDVVDVVNAAVRDHHPNVPYGWTSAPAWGTVYGWTLGGAVARYPRRPPHPDRHAVHPLDHGRWTLGRTVLGATVLAHVLHTYRAPHAFACLARAAGWTSIVDVMSPWIGPTWTRRGRYMGVTVQWIVVVVWLWTYRWTWSVTAYALAYLPWITVANRRPVPP